MALKLAIEKLEDVEEAHRPLYAEKDGKFHLQVDGIEDTTGLRSALGKERHARAELEKKVKKWESIGKTDEEIADLIARHEEHQQSEAERKGEWDKLKAQMNEKHLADIKKMEAKLGDKDQVIGKLQSSLERNLIDANATAAIAAEKGVPRLLLPHVRDHVKVVEENGAYQIRVVDEKGEPRVNGKGDPLSIAEMVAEMKSSDVFGRAFDGAGQSGGGMQPANGYVAGSGSIKRRSELKTEKEKAAFVDANGIEAYIALPT